RLLEPNAEPEDIVSLMFKRLAIGTSDSGSVPVDDLARGEPQNEPSLLDPVLQTSGPTSSMDSVRQTTEPPSSEESPPSVTPIAGARLAPDVVSDVLNITFILGPPGPEERKQLVEQVSAGSGKNKDEVWLDLAHAMLHQLAHRIRDGGGFGVAEVS